MTCSAATCSPRRSRNRLRPLTTLSPFSVEEMTPRNWAVTNGSSTTVSRLLGGFVAPSRRVARSAASPAALSRSKPLGLAGDAEAEAGLRLVAVVGEAADADVAAVLPAALADAGRGGHGDLAPGVGVVGVVDADPRVDAERQPLELLGQLDLARRSGTPPARRPTAAAACGRRRRARPARPTRRRCRTRRCRGPRRGPRRRRSGRACRRRRSRCGRRG